ncbi:proline-rich receptor-like protein kinase PERK8 [Piliocolobus tephrosceles]|uniref:proline-rich receptor-like protein kinase PERK8 n=1 Tax=Piliocolobus tephrosceles TaxID=591936 RepID=UPI000E6B0D77|nr:proline-rich receptor-like protein kinase PERK8 [Piliocolobus tephrosceles]
MRRVQPRAAEPPIRTHRSTPPDLQIHSSGPADPPLWTCRSTPPHPQFHPSGPADPPHRPTPPTCRSTHPDPQIHPSGPTAGCRCMSPEEPSGQCTDTREPVPSLSPYVHTKEKPCEGRARSQSASQENSPYQNSTMLVPGLGLPASRTVRNMGIAVLQDLMASVWNTIALWILSVFGVISGAPPCLGRSSKSPKWMADFHGVCPHSTPHITQAADLEPR